MPRGRQKPNHLSHPGAPENGFLLLHLLNCMETGWGPEGYGRGIN